MNFKWDYYGYRDFTLISNVRTFTHRVKIRVEEFQFQFLSLEEFRVAAYSHSVGATQCFENIIYKSWHDIYTMNERKYDHRSYLSNFPRGYSFPSLLQKDRINPNHDIGGPCSSVNISIGLLSLVQERRGEIKRKWRRKTRVGKRTGRGFGKELTGAFEHGRGRSVLFERKVGSEIGRGRGKEEKRKRYNGQS